MKEDILQNLPFSLDTQNFIKTLKFEGSWTYRSGKKQLDLLKKTLSNLDNFVADFTNVEKLDYFMAYSIKNLMRGKSVEFRSQNPKIEKIFEFISDESIDHNFMPKVHGMGILAQIGLYFCAGWAGIVNLATFLGEFFCKIFSLFLHPRKFRLKETVNFIKDNGIDSLFIVALTAFLIGVVLAYIGADMLSQFGASIYIIDIMGALTMREIAPLIAAIVIAGRSASSFTAQIGVMKITEEIDAMKTMGFDPFYFLSMPRILAMVICMPFIIFIANSICIFAQMIVCEAYLEIGFLDYLDRFKSNVEIRHFFAGMIKAPFFGAFIAIIGCMRGFEVKGNTQSIGEYTTISVVNAIFWVIAIDAIFAILFSEIGL
ncbi:ABC transporter permease [Campylobacter sp. JMF_14 EL1]|nr:ABC transporter permease [Campylobacter sp. JMF_14 EL1]